MFTLKHNIQNQSVSLKKARLSTHYFSLDTFSNLRSDTACGSTDNSATVTLTDLTTNGAISPLVPHARTSSL